MIDAALGSLFAPWTERCARRVSGIAGVVALAGFLVGLAAAVLVARHWAWIGLAVFVFSRLISAVAMRASAGNAATVPVFDAVALAALPFAFALADPSRGVAAVFLIFAMSAQVAASLRFGRGLIANTELAIAFVVAAALPDRFGIVAYVTGILCFVSAGFAMRRAL